MAEFTTTQPEVREYPDRRILAVTRKGWVNGNYVTAAIAGADTLFGFLDEHAIPFVAGSYMGIMPDNPMESDPAESRYITAVILEEDAQVPASIDVQEEVLPGGREAVVLHTGSLEFLGESWMTLNDFVDGQAAQRRAPSYEVYVDDPPTTPPERQRMELHVPIH